MRQHTVPSRGSSTRPRLLIEDAHPALQVSDLACFRDAGFDVAVCSGPETAADECPLVRGEECALATGADIVVFGPDRLTGAGREVLDAFRERFPGCFKLVAEAPHAPGTEGSTPEGCTPMAFPSSVGSQVEAVNRVLHSRHRVLHSRP